MMFMVCFYNSKHFETFCIIIRLEMINFIASLKDKLSGLKFTIPHDFRTVLFWQKLFIYFWIIAVAGHYIERAWAIINRIIVGAPPWHLIVPTVVPMAIPYGSGAVTIILTTVMLMKRFKLNPLAVFGINVVISGLVEYTCAALIVLIDGTNRFWNYSWHPFNINGYTCLESSLLLGIVATIFVYLIYPLVEKIFAKLKYKYVNVIFWVLLSVFVVDSVYSWLR